MGSYSGASIEPPYNGSKNEANACIESPPIPKACTIFVPKNVAFIAAVAAVICPAVAAALNPAPTAPNETIAPPTAKPAPIPNATFFIISNAFTSSSFSSASLHRKHTRKSWCRSLGGFHNFGVDPPSTHPRVTAPPRQTRGVRPLRDDRPSTRPWGSRQATGRNRCSAGSSRGSSTPAARIPAPRRCAQAHE